MRAFAAGTPLLQGRWPFFGINTAAPGTALDKATANDLFPAVAAGLMEAFQSDDQ
jgi:hypothetical protein